MIEKPIDVSLAAADRLIAAAEGAGVVLTVISQHRFDPGVVELHRLASSGALGRLVLAASETKWYRKQEYYDSGEWRGTWSLDGGGALMNQGVHYTDLLRWCLGPIAEVSAVCATQFHDIEVEDVALAWLRFASGAVGTLAATTTFYPGKPERLEITGTAGSGAVEEGVLVLRELLAERAMVGGGTDGARAEKATASAAADPAAVSFEGHARQIADLLDAVEHERDPLVTGASAREALEVVLAVYESARRGGAVVRLPAVSAEPER